MTHSHIKLLTMCHVWPHPKLSIYSIIRNQCPIGLAASAALVGTGTLSKARLLSRVVIDKRSHVGLNV